MSWVQVTADDLDDTKLAPLVAALRSAALASGQSDPVVALTARVVTEIRKAIAAGGSPVDSVSSNTLPPSLLSLASRLVLWDAKGRLELDRDYDKSDHEEDLKTLERLRKGIEAVEPPDNAELPDLSTGVGVEVVASRGREATRQQLSGLL